MNFPKTLDEVDIKDAQDLVDSDPVCSPEILQLARWVADYYACPLGEVIKAALPPGMTPQQRTAELFVKPKLRRFVRLRQTIRRTKTHRRTAPRDLHTRNQWSNVVAVVATNGGRQCFDNFITGKESSRRDLRRSDSSRSAERDLGVQVRRTHADHRANIRARHRSNNR